MTILTFKPYLMSGGGPKNQKCFVCGEPGSDSLQASTESETAAKKIQERYESLGLYASIVPGSSPNSPDIKLSACGMHLPDLNNHYDLHYVIGEITLDSIVMSLIK